MATLFKFSIPNNISAETAKFMNAVLRELRKKQKIMVLDSGALYMLMTSYEMYLQATEILLVNGPVTKNKYGESIPNPAQTIATKNYNQVLAIMKEYGLTAKSRMHLKEPDDDGKDTAFDQYLTGKKES